MIHHNYLLWPHPPKYLKKAATLLAMMTFFIQFSFAQTVSGTVLDDAGEPVIGANVIVPGTTVGTITDFDGTFSLTVPDGTEELSISYLGYREMLLRLDGSSNYSIAMSPDSEMLDEIVVVGYGVQRKSNLIGSVASLKGEDIKGLAVGNPTAALQGKMAGIQVENNGGAPGGTSNVFVRGVGSLTNSFPQYVVDGTFVNDMSFLNPKDIESIEVLKDASSAAIYGSRAANGVVLISTKKGNDDGSTRISLDVRGGVEAPTKMLDLLNGEQFVQYRNQLEQNDGTGFVMPSGLPSTDWQDLSLNSGGIQDYGISFSGGTENAKFYASANYFKQDGILVGSGYDRLNARINSVFTLGNFTVTPSLGLANTNLQENNWFGFDGATAPILAESVEGNDGGFEAPDFDIHNFGGLNKYALASLEDNNLNQKNLLGNINFNYSFTDNLSVRLNFGADYVNGFAKTFVPTYFMSNSDAVINVNELNDLTEVRSETLFTMWEPTISYDLPMNNNGNLNVVLGYGEYKTDFGYNAVYAQGTPTNGIQVLSGVGPSGIAAIGGENVISGLTSLFGRANYNHANKYLFQATVRRDGSSRFPEENRYGVFPSFSVGWKIHNESFFNSGNINRLKLRAGYGTLGSQNIPDYAFQSTFGLTSGVSFGGGQVPGYAQTEFALETLKWEETTTTNIGVDVGLNNDKFQFTAEYYIKDINDVLVAVNLPSTAGTSLPVVDNVGTMQNSGFELEGLYRGGGNSKFNYQIGLNFATLSSEITSLPNPIIGPSTSEDLTRVNRFIEGEAPGVYWGFQIDGVYADQAAIDNDPNIANDPTRQSQVQPGDFIRRDVDSFDENGELTGIPDGMVDGADQTILGDPTPDFIYGLNFTGNAGAIDFGIFFSGVQGNEIYNLNKFFNMFWADDNKLVDVLDAWTPTNTNTDIPRATAQDAAGNRAPSSFFVEDGSYLRLRSLELGYTFGEGKLFESMRGLRVFVTGQNLLTISGYSGYDPDVSSTNGGRANRDTGFQGFRSPVNPILGRGLDSRAYPNARAFVFGIQANF